MQCAEGAQTFVRIVIPATPIEDDHERVSKLLRGTDGDVARALPELPAHAARLGGPDAASAVVSALAGKLAAVYDELAQLRAQDSQLVVDEMRVHRSQLGLLAEVRNRTSTSEVCSTVAEKLVRAERRQRRSEERLRAEQIRVGELEKQRKIVLSHCQREADEEYRRGVGGKRAGRPTQAYLDNADAARELLDATSTELHFLAGDAADAKRRAAVARRHAENRERARARLAALVREERAAMLRRAHVPSSLCVVLPSAIAAFVLDNKVMTEKRAERRALRKAMANESLRRAAAQPPLQRFPDHLRALQALVRGVMKAARVQSKAHARLLAEQLFLSVDERCGSLPPPQRWGVLSAVCPASQALLADALRTADASSAPAPTRAGALRIRLLRLWWREAPDEGAPGLDGTAAAALADWAEGADRLRADFFEFEELFESMLVRRELQDVYDQLIRPGDVGSLRYFLAQQQNKESADVVAPRWRDLPGCWDMADFSRYVTSDENSWCAHDAPHDMTKPLPHYFIWSRSVSSVAEVAQALLRGVRCVGLTLCDGPGGSPGIAGSGELFSAAVAEMRAHAFTRSPYPAVLRLDVQASAQQQQTAAAALQGALGDLLLGELPEDAAATAPEELRERVLVLADSGALAPALASCVCLRESGLRPGGLREHTDSDHTDAVRTPVAEVAEFSRSPDMRTAFADLTRRGLVRASTVPGDRSELCTAWSAGCQIVSLPLEAEPSFVSRLADASFNRNAAAGYLLKPECLRFVARDPRSWTDAVQLQVTVTSGGNLPKTFSSLRVLVFVSGPEPGAKARGTKVVHGNAFNPRWGDTFGFRVQMAEFAIVTCRVVDGSPDTPAFVAEASCAVKALQHGHRSVPLLDERGARIPDCFLLCNISWSSTAA